MGLMVRHIHTDAKTGRLSYRRAFPAELRPLIPKRMAALKVTLGATSLNAEAMKRFAAAQVEYNRMVTAARLKASGTSRPLTEGDIAFLTQTHAHRLRKSLSDTHYAEDDASRDWITASAWRYAPFAFMDAAGAELAGRESPWTNSQRIRERLPQLLTHWHALRADGDRTGIIEAEGQTAVDLITEHHLTADIDAPAFFTLCRALLSADIAAGEQLERLAFKGLDIEPVEAPQPLSRPEVADSSARPSGDAQQSFEAVAYAILDNPRQAIGASTKQSAATALRFFREACGTPAPAKITRLIVSEWIDLTAQRPRKLPQSQAGLPLKEVAELYVGRTDVPRLSSKTYNGYASALAALWNKAQKAGQIGEGQNNPFANQRVANTSMPASDDPKGFSTEELEAIFALPIFTQGERPKRGKGDASYWIPLLLLWTGARPEEVAQLIVSDFKQGDGEGLTVSFTDIGTHPHKGQRSLKTSKKQTGRRTIPVPQSLMDLGLPAYLAYLRAKGETALFPLLRTKGARGLLFAAWGEWWSKLIREKRILKNTGYQRQPSREFRHAWTTAARASGISREAREYIQGHKAAGGTANEGYGDHTPTGRLPTHLQFDGVDLSMVTKWQTPL